MNNSKLDNKIDCDFEYLVDFKKIFKEIYMNKFISLTFNLYSDKACKKLIATEECLVNVNLIKMIKPLCNGTKTQISFITGVCFCENPYVEVASKVML